MEIIDAVWEKRNLNVYCKEAIVQSDESVKEVLDQLSILEEAEYVVIKLPVARMDIMQELSKCGYYFIECLANLSVVPQQAVLPLAKWEMDSQVTYCKIVNRDSLYEKIRQGIFKTDRVYLDSYFTKEQAASRYIYWIEDEFERGTEIYEIIYKDRPVGFFTLKEQFNGVYYPVLIGLYPGEEGVGLGYAVARKPVEEVIKRKGKQVVTCISMNNPFCLRVHLQQGFMIDKIQYVFIKHISH